MKCYQSVLLFFIFVSSILAIDECKRGGTCGRNSLMLDEFGTYIMQEPNDLVCYYYKCRINEWTIMKGFGSHQDFINTCRYLDPMIKRETNSLHVGTNNFMYNDNNLIVAVCVYDNQQECEKIFNDKVTYKKVHEKFDQERYLHTAFKHEIVAECTYNNTPLIQLPQVQCETGGVCQSGKGFYLRRIEKSTFVNKTCDACVMFVCSMDGKQIIEGSGCYDDFVKACKDVNPGAVARFNENKATYTYENGKEKFYYDSSLIVASCADADNCHKYAFDNYLTQQIYDTFYVDKYAEEECLYEEKIIEKTNKALMPELFFEYQCKRGGACGTSAYVIEFDNYIMQEPEWSNSCYYYKCRIGERMVLGGYRTYDDFINTCKYIDPIIKREAGYYELGESDSSFMYNDDRLILAVCSPEKTEECEKIFKDKETYKKIHEQFDRFYRLFAFQQPKVFECSYNNTPLPKLPQVQCETGGICQTGGLYLPSIRYVKFVTKTCDACVMFVCSMNGKQIIEGTGCYEDFVTACKDVHPGAVTRFKERRPFSDYDIKSNFYYDSSLIVASCSDADNCHKYTFDYYVTKKILDNFYVDGSAQEKCSYEKMIETTTLAPFMTTKNVHYSSISSSIVVPDIPVSTLDASYLPTSTESTDAPVLSDEQKSNGITSMKLFFGIYFILALIF